MGLYGIGFLTRPSREASSLAVPLGASTFFSEA